MPNRFAYIKRGYDPDEVDAKIDSLEDIIKGYRDKDAAIKNAILSAQIAADNIIQNAKNQAAEIRTAAVEQIKDIQLSVVTQKDMLAQFQNEYNILAKKYLKDVNEEDIKVVAGKIDALEKHLQRLTNNDAPKAERKPEKPAQNPEPAKEQ